MNKKTKIIIGAATWAIILAIAASALIASCSQDNSVSEDASDNGMLLNDDLVAIKESDGNITIKNTETGEVTAEKIKFDWTSSSPNDSLGVFCSKGKRGYYNSYTGKIVVEAQYRRAWIFSEGLAAVQKMVISASSTARVRQLFRSVSHTMETHFLSSYSKMVTALWLIRQESVVLSTARENGSSNHYTMISVRMRIMLSYLKRVRGCRSVMMDEFSTLLYWMI